jgi:glutathione S-transferase
MDLYFSPLACSLASRIALYEADADADARFIEVDPKTKRTMAGDDYRAIYPLGLVPLIRLDDGSLLSENAAVLQYVAARYPGADLGGRDDLERARLQQWLCFIGTELHKALFIPLFDQSLSEDAKARARDKSESRFAFLDNHLRGRDFLLDRFTVADAYLYTVLNWTGSTKVDLTPWPAIAAYHKRMQARPSIAKAFKEEFALYQAELARHKAA